MTARTDSPLSIPADGVQLEGELAAFSGSPQCQASLCASDFLAWQGLVPAQDEMFDPIRFVRDELDLSAVEMFELRQ